MLLNLPNLSDYAANFDLTNFNDLQKRCKLLFDAIHQIAVEYTTEESAMQHEVDSGKIVGSQNDYVSIILGKKSNVTGKALYTMAFNKTKHRFMVSEDVSKYESKTDELSLARIELTDERILGEIDGIAAVARVMRDLSDLIITLDQADISI